MVAVKHSTVALLDFTAWFRARRREEYDKFVVTPVPKSDKVNVKFWNSTSAVRKRIKV